MPASQSSVAFAQEFLEEHGEAIVRAALGAASRAGIEPEELGVSGLIMLGAKSALAMVGDLVERHQESKE